MTNDPHAQSDTSSQANGETPVEGRKPRLLAVDDVADSAELVARVASRSGYESRFTTDPAEVDVLVREWRPDVLVTDISMPGMDAIELTTVLSTAGFAGKLVFVSGLEDWMRNQAAKLANMHGLTVVANMQKPVDVGELKGFLQETQAV